jgi:septal ring factor EnvC (AmiA/AmiB activator)
MNKQNANIESEPPTPEAQDASQIPAQPEPVAIPAKAEKPQPSRLRRFFRTVLILLIVIAISFLVGVITDHYVRYKPLSKALTETQTALNQANQEIDALQAETERLNTKIQEVNDNITTLEGQKKDVQDELDAATAHLELLQVLVDVSNARIALLLNDVKGAEAALVNTPQRLDNLLPRIAEFDTNLAQSTPKRLSLIFSGMNRDIETAKIDLELFTKDLLEIEAALFSD